MDKKKIFGIILFITIGLFMFSFANPNEEVELYDCGDEEKSMQEEVTACVNEKMEEGSTEKKALSSCRKTYCNGVTNEDNKDKQDENTTKEETTSNNQNEENTANDNVVNNTTNTVVNNNQTTTGNQNDNQANTGVGATDNDENKTDNEDNFGVGTTDDVDQNESLDNNQNNESTEKDEVDELSNLKEQSILELKQYFESKNFDEEYQEQTKNILETGVNNINASESKEEVEKALENAKKELDDLLNKQELENYKKDSVNDIKDYANNLEVSDAKDEIIDNAKEQIENTTTKEEVDKIVDSTKEELNELKEKEDLADAKEKAIEELKNYKNDYKFEEENKKLYEELLNELIEKINSSESIEEVNNNLEFGKQEIDELINEDLNSYKEKAINEINNYVDLNDYREEQQNEIKNIIESATNDINSSLTKEEIDEIVNNVKETIDAIKTNEELTIEETRYVTFVDYNGKVIEKQAVKVGESAVAPSATMNYTSRYITHTFTGWDKDFANIQENITVSPLYEITAIKANIYVLKEGNVKPSNGESLGVNAYEHLSTVELNVTDELKNIIKANETVTISLDKETILANVISKMPIAKEFYYYDYYVIKFEKNDGFHIDCELVFDNVAFENYKQSIVNEIKNYSDSLKLNDENQAKANVILNDAITNINNATTKEEIESSKQIAIQELNNLFSSIKDSNIKEIEAAINNAGFTGSYVDKANNILENAKNEINNAKSELEIISIKDKYLNEINSLISLANKTFVADINTKNIFRLKRLSITDIASDVIINKISYVYPLGFVDTKYVNNEYHSSILLDEEIEDVLFGSTLVKIEYTKDNVKYVNNYDIERNILSSITGLKLISTDLVK